METPLNPFREGLECACASTALDTLRTSTALLPPTRERGGIWILLLSFLLLLPGCKEETAVSAHSADRSAAASEPARRSVVPPAAKTGTPQPKLPTVKLWVGTNEISAEIARTPVQIATGMMWRTNMAEMEGMLFVFPAANDVAFYMRNTLLPLSCAYIDPQGTVLELHDMTPLDETPIPSKSQNVQFVLEMNQGWFERNNVRPGMLIRSEHGALYDTFLRPRR